MSDRTPSTIVFGKLPDLGASRFFRFQPVERCGYWALPSDRIEVYTAEMETHEHVYGQRDKFQLSKLPPNFAILDTGIWFYFSLIRPWI